MNSKEKEEYEKWFLNQQEIVIETKDDNIEKEQLYLKGDRVFIGSIEYEIVVISSEEVVLSEVQYPLLVKEYEKYEKFAVGELDAREYYTNFMNKSLDIPVVELKALRKANETGQANYELKELEKCEDDSYVTLTVNKETKVVEGYEHHLNCK